MSSFLLVDGDTACPVCEGECKGFDEEEWERRNHAAFPFARGGRELVAGEEGKDYVIAPFAIVDEEQERNVYGVGDRVPMEDAIKYGLVAKKATAAKRARKATSNRARKPGSNR